MNNSIKEKIVVVIFGKLFYHGNGIKNLFSTIDRTKRGGIIVENGSRTGIEIE